MADSHAEHKRTDAIMSNCPDCLAELREAAGDDETDAIMIKAAKDAASRLDMDAINALLMTDEAQWFMQILNLDGGAFPKVWMRLFAADFMAECSVRRKGSKRRRTITGSGKTIEEALNALASALAEYLYPTEAPGQ